MRANSSSLYSHCSSYCGILFVLVCLNGLLSVTAQSDDGCDILLYTNITEPPERRRDSRDTCPEGSGARAYLLNLLENLPSSGHLHHGSEVQPKPKLKEVAPDNNQHFRCLQNQKCYIVSRGFGIGHLDALAVLPLGQNKCPPSSDILNHGVHEDNASDMPVVVQSEHLASLASSRLPTPEASFAAFELPDRAALSNGSHTVCYAPALASEARSIDELQASDFHHYAGLLEIGDKLLSCNFEAVVPEHMQGDLADTPLPCGFRNFRERWQANLIWQLGSNNTETSATGPHNDATPGFNGKGHYMYMDSPGYALGAAATLVSPPIAFPFGGYCVQFDYSMYGEDVSTLRAYLHEVKLTPLRERVIQKPFTDVDTNLLGDWGSPRWVAVGNKGDSWHKGGFEFNSQAMQTYQLVFEALAGKSEYGDIAIDNVEITPGRCPVEVRHHLPKTLGQSNQALVCGEVRLSTGEHSVDKSWYVDGAVSCSGKGYSLDNLNNTAWLPCCVPHFGTYKIVLQDHFGDGWTGSKLEFRFFDRVMTFGDDNFQTVGFDKIYNLVIGTLEVTEVQKMGDNHLGVSVRVARPGSYVWCGVVQAGHNGKPLKIDLTPDLLKKYGVRSSKASSEVNEILSLGIKDVLKKESAYDLYCYSEVKGENLKGDESLEQQKHEIAASRMRISTDRKAPTLSNIAVKGEFHSIDVTFSIDESSAVWCSALRKTEGSQSPTMFTSGPLQGLSESINEKEEQRMVRYFQTSGEGIEIIVEQKEKPLEQKIVINALSPDTEYEVYCYSEDFAEPYPNRMTPFQVNNTLQIIRTEAKVPTIRIVRRQTLHRGFRLFIKADAPGKAWCAAAPSDYGVPDVTEIVRVGATAEVKEPRKEVSLEVSGVEPNTAYIIYCVGGYSEKSLEDTGKYQEYSEPDEMIYNSVPVVSYGKYCDENEGPETITIMSEITPFHPISAEEEMRVRNYIMGRSELALEGIYRINILPNKTEIKNYYQGKGPKPLRYARVRAGRCVNNVGAYEQLRVGPLDGIQALSYERVAQPIETDCGGYNPQGVFGRRLMDISDWKSAISELNQWFKKSFGYEFGVEKCDAELEPLTLTKPRLAGNTNSNRYPHDHHRECLQLGPVMIQEACDEITDENIPCSNSNRAGRVWLGLKTPTGDQVPFYFVYKLPVFPNENTSTQESPEEWVRRIIRDKELPGDFHEIWEVSEIWVDGHVYSSIEDFFTAVGEGEVPNFNPKLIAEGRRLKSEEILRTGRNERRRLQPNPYPGAAGTAGPLPSRTARRGGLEYRSHPEHIEAQGKRFTVQASDDDEEFIISFAGWNMTVTNDRDTALRIYQLTFQDQNVAFEMGLREALAHYSVSERNWFFLDSWYGGLGAAARKVHRGIECPKTAVSLFWDGSLCVFEQDMARPTRSHWKSGEIRDGAPHTTLVLRQMLTVSNYDYVTDYRFHLTGIFEASVSFTGELYAGIEVPWYSARQSDYGVQVTGAMRFAALHNHMAVWKVDLDVGPGDDYMQNSIHLTEVIPDPARPGANKLKKSFAETERDAIYYRNDTRALVYEVVDEKIRIFGNVGGWRVIPFPGINPLHHDFELYSGPAAWAKYRAFSTVHKYGEMDSTLPRDNKYAKRPATSVDRYIWDDEPLRNQDIVTWISDGIFHVPVIEDMPLTIPVGNTLGWMIKPANLFLEDPSMDLANSMGGGVEDPGTCAVVRVAIGEVEPVLEDAWERYVAPPLRNSNG